MRVLVVEDSAVVRERVVARIRDIAGVELVTETTDIAGALDALESVAPDLVILDLNLPGKSGMELLPILKTQAAPPVVVVLTNETSDECGRRCRELGADYFFDKSKQFQMALDIVEIASVRLGNDAQRVGENLTAGADERPTMRSGSRRQTPSQKMRKP
jgi:DNA-binding NarL/FixJ family response regulator